MINSHFFRNFTKQSFVSEQGLRGSSMIYLHGSYQGKSLQGSTRPRPEEGGTMSEGLISSAEVLLGLSKCSMLLILLTNVLNMMRMIKYSSPLLSI